MTVKILIAFLVAFVALAAVPAAAQTTGTATVGGTVEKRAWNLLSGHVWTDAGGNTYLNAGCQNIDPQPWGTLSSTVRLQIRIYLQGSSQPIYDTRPYYHPGRDLGLDCDLSKGIDIVTFLLPDLTWGEGWKNLVGLRMQLIIHRPPAHLGVANNASQTWARLYFGNSNPYPGTGILSSDRTRVVTEDELYNPDEYQR